MAPQKVKKSLTQKARMEIFQALVEAQDGGLPVRQSRKVVAERFGINEQVLRQIEEEGLDREWPPL